MFILFFCSAFVLLDFLILETQGKVFFIQRFSVLSLFLTMHKKLNSFQCQFCTQFTIVYASFQGCFNFVLAIILINYAFTSMIAMRIQRSLVFCACGKRHKVEPQNATTSRNRPLLFINHFSKY